MILWLMRILFPLPYLKLYYAYMISYSWIRMKLLGLDWNWIGKLKEKLTRIDWVEKPYGVGTCEVYGFIHSHQNLMKINFTETRHLDLSNHINYKAIGLVLSEIWFFEVYPRFLPLDLIGVGCVGHNSPYTTSI